MGGKTQWETEGSKGEERWQDGAEVGYLSCAGNSDVPASALTALNFLSRASCRENHLDQELPGPGVVPLVTKDLVSMLNPFLSPLSPDY